MYELRKLVAAHLRVRTPELPDLTKQAFQDIEAGIGEYAWAFDLEEDAHSLMRLTQSSHFKAYPRPQRLEEAGVDVLFSLFPSNCTKVEELDAVSVCRHPHLGPRAGSGSVQSEAPHLIPRKDWLKAYGFGRGGLYLVKCGGGS